MTTTLSAPATSGVHARTEPTVRWSHVLPLAVALAFANGFWIVALRGAVGAIARTSQPFSAWLRESLLLVPWYTLAVAAAFSLALRWFGARPSGPARVAGTAGLVAAGATLAGAVALVGSSILDYRLQVVDLQHMATVHAGCGPACFSERLQATAHLQVESVLVGAVLMALTDLVVVALVIAFRGGRIEVAGTRAAGARSRAGSGLLLGALLLGAAAIHAAVVPEHLLEWPAAGSFLAALAVAEAAVAASVLWSSTRAARPALVAAAAVSAVPLLVWTVSRTSGLPFGPEAGTPEAIGPADVLAGLLELATLALAVGVLRGTAPGRPWRRHDVALAMTGVVAATALGVGASSLGVVSFLPDQAQHPAPADENGVLQ